MSNQDIKLSKLLSWLLRHEAITQGFRMSPEGYIEVNEILQHYQFKGKFTAKDIERVVARNEKQRFLLRRNPTNNLLEIKATQGHTLDVSDAELTPLLQPIYASVVHGTFLNCWPQIYTEGLCRMQRQHIHFAKGTLKDSTVISGIRKNAQVYIFINFKKALEDGIKFFESENGVILTRGNTKGYLEQKYFEKAIEVSTGRQLYP